MDYLTSDDLLRRIRAEVERCGDAAEDLYQRSSVIANTAIRADNRRRWKTQASLHGWYAGVLKNILAMIDESMYEEEQRGSESSDTIGHH